MTPRRFRYSPWDGTQTGFEFDAFDLMEQLTDDLLYHGDLNAALRRMLQDGFEDGNGRRVSGLRELLEHLRAERRERLDRYDLGGVYDDIAGELREVIDLERAAVDALGSMDGDERARELAAAEAERRRLDLDMLPPDLAGQVRSLQEYDFTSSEAERRFDELVDALRRQLMAGMTEQLAGAMESMTDEDIARMKDMFAELNRMLEDREAGRPVDFDGFMERFGDMFPEQPRSLDELLAVMAARMAAMSSLMASMTPGQRAQLAALSDQLLSDLDLRWEVDQLGSHLRSMFPDAGWDADRGVRGTDPLDLSQAIDLMGELGDLDQLENLLRGSTTPGALAEVDLDRVRAVMGDDAARHLEALEQLSRTLEEAGLTENREQRLELTPAGMRRLGQNALAELFRTLDHDLLGGHRTERPGVGHERSDESRAYEWGDPFNLNIGRTLHNAISRGAAEHGVSGQAGDDRTPRGRVSLAPSDFEIDRTEQTVRSATVLMLDLSLSMPMRDNFLPAKKVAMALHALISMQYPRDYLGIVGFSEVARELKASELPEVSWDFVYGTNMHHGFAIARRLLARQHGTRQIIMITDGEPTAHINAAGEAEFHYPPIAETVDATLREVARCTREGIRINTFMLDADRGLQHFVERLAELNRGRAFFTTPDTLGDFVLVDFLRDKRALLRGRRSGAR